MATEHRDASEAREATHVTARFAVWNGDRAWFWFLEGPNGGRGAIGVAATEADALGDACAAFEEMASPRDEELAAGFSPGSRDTQGLLRCDPAEMPAWMGSLRNLERYLERVNRACIE